MIQIYVCILQIYYVIVGKINFNGENLAPQRSSYSNKLIVYLKYLFFFSGYALAHLNTVPIIYNR